MRGRKNPINTQTPPNLPPCKICGEQGTGFHYGVTACGACKGFFRRSLVRKQPYVCNGNGHCVIGPETKRRKSCPKCRHDKCLAVGMSKEAIKTGRYSYVKKSHDIIEMIEHHFQHYVKRKQFGDCKMSESITEDALGISAKKFRSSCALEKISDAFRKPNHAFMELSPTKSTFASQNAFNFDDSNITNETVFPVNDVSSLIHPENEKIGVIKDATIKNDIIGAQANTQHAATDINSGHPGWCSDIRDSEFAYYFNSPTNELCETPPTSSPVSSSSPMSDLSNSRGSSAPISPSWLEFPNYSDSLCTATSTDDNRRFLAYSDKGYDGDFEHYSQQQGWNETAYFNNDDYDIVSKDERSHMKQNFFSNQANCPFQSYTSQQDQLFDCSVSSPEYNPYSKEQISAQNTELLHLHTPVSNELEQLRRLSWSDMSFGDDFLCPVSGFITDTPAKQPKSKTVSDNASACFYPTNHNLTTDKAGTAESVFPESSISSYWDLDATTLKTTDASFSNTTDFNKDHFPFVNDITQSCTPYSSSVIHANYYRERQGSESSTGMSSIDARQSPDIASVQETSFEYKPQTSNCQSALTADGISKGGEYMDASLNSCGLSELLDKSSLSINAPSPLFSISDLDKALTKDPVIISETSGAVTLEESNEPLNFLNIPYEQVRPIGGKGQLMTNSALDSMGMSFDSDDTSPKGTEHLTKQFSDVINDDEHLEKWTPFSLCGETPRSIEQDDELQNRVRLHENDEDYKNKSLPWCEFTEAELDEVVLSLKTAYQKHVVIDSHLLSDEEIAEKLKSFLDILKLREQTYGKLIVMDREAYFNILEATGIDVGGRRDWTETHAKILNRTLQKTVRFFRSVPGFKDVCHEDKIILAKSCLYEYVILSCYRAVNLEKQVILDAEHKYAISVDIIKLIVPEMQDHMLDMLEISRRLMDLKLSFEETLILKAISITSPDRDKIQDFETVDRMYWRLHCCLLLSLWRRMTTPWQFYARVISVLTDLRGLAYYGRQIMSNLKPDIMKLTKDIQVPLYLEMLFSETDSMPTTSSSLQGEASTSNNTNLPGL